MAPAHCRILTPVINSPVSSGTTLKSLNPFRANRYAIDVLIFYIPRRLKNRPGHENRPQDTQLLRSYQPWHPHTETGSRNAWGVTFVVLCFKFLVDWRQSVEYDECAGDIGENKARAYCLPPLMKPRCPMPVGVSVLWLGAGWVDMYS